MLPAGWQLSRSLSFSGRANPRCPDSEPVPPAFAGSALRCSGSCCGGWFSSTFLSPGDAADAGKSSCIVAGSRLVRSSSSGDAVHRAVTHTLFSPSLPLPPAASVCVSEPALDPEKEQEQEVQSVWRSSAHKHSQREDTPSPASTRLYVPPTTVILRRNNRN